MLFGRILAEIYLKMHILPQPPKSPSLGALSTGLLYVLRTSYRK